MYFIPLDFPLVISPFLVLGDDMSLIVRFEFIVPVPLPKESPLLHPKLE